MTSVSKYETLYSRQQKDHPMSDRLASLRKMAASAATLEERDALNSVVDRTLADPGNVLQHILDEKDTPHMLRLLAASELAKASS